MKKSLLSLFFFATFLIHAQYISEVNYQVNGYLPTAYDNAGTILYPTGYNMYSSATPVIFVHGIFGKLSGSYEANINQVVNYGLKAAFVQLESVGNTTDNGMMLSKMIDKVRSHYNCATVSIVAHSRGGIDTEKALYYLNPYDTSIPSFSYEKVDGVYTFSSPLRGARIADIGSALSWFSGVSWIAMWYTNGWSMTSGHVNAVHNWEKSWTIISNTTFKNYYNPYGASYVRTNMTEDNTTRWWAHQSDDACYQNLWYFCYLGNAFQHTFGAYYDAYWEWDWFNSGWRNWHSSNDGLISEYRAKRSIITNAYPQLTPGAGDFNWRTMQDANHTSLWDPGQYHFSNEVAPYLHTGLYYNYSPSNNTPQQAPTHKDRVENAISQIMGSNGAVYYSDNSHTEIIVEDDQAKEVFFIYAEIPLDEIRLTRLDNGQSFTLQSNGFEEDQLSGAFVSGFEAGNLNKGLYTVECSSKDFLLIQSHENPQSAFALNLNFDEEKGYKGEYLEVKIDHSDKLIDFSKLSLNAYLTRVSEDGETLTDIDKTPKREYTFLPGDKPGTYRVKFEGLKPGAVYSLRVQANIKEGDALLSRSILHTFHTYKKMEQKSITVTHQDNNINKRMGYLNIFPNPSQGGKVHLVYDHNTIDTVILTDDKGNVLRSYTPGASEFDFTVERPGLYFIKVISGTEIQVRKLYVE